MNAERETARIVRAMVRLGLDEDEAKKVVEPAITSGICPKKVEKMLRHHVRTKTGLIQRRQTKDTGVTVSVYEAAKGGYCTDGGPYVTICEEHSTICNHDTLKLALAHAPYCEWCEECMDAWRKRHPGH